MSVCAIELHRLNQCCRTKEKIWPQNRHHGNTRMGGFQFKTATSCLAGGFKEKRSMSLIISGLRTFHLVLLHPWDIFIQLQYFPDSLTDLLVDWLTDLLSYFLTYYFTDFLTYSLIYLLADLLTHWLTSFLPCLSSYNSHYHLSSSLSLSLLCFKKTLIFWPYKRPIKQAKMGIKWLQLDLFAEWGGTIVGLVFQKLHLPWRIGRLECGWGALMNPVQFRSLAAE